MTTVTSADNTGTFNTYLNIIQDVHPTFARFDYQQRNWGRRYYGRTTVLRMVNLRDMLVREGFNG